MTDEYWSHVADAEQALSEVIQELNQAKLNLEAERVRSQAMRKEMEDMRLKLSRLMIEAADAIGRWEAP